MIRIAICDDNVVFLKSLHEKVSAFFKNRLIRFEISRFTHHQQLLEKMNTSTYDLIILDIMFDNTEVTGIDIAKQLNKVDKNTQIIFISTYSRFFMEVYEAEHIYFVVKDSLNRNLNVALQKALVALDYEKKQNFVSIRYKGEIHQVNFGRIIFLENQLRKIRFHFHQEDIFTYAKFDDFKEYLNSDNFIQCHRSFIVNKEYIRKFTKNELIMKDESIIPISRLYRQKLLSSLFIDEDSINEDGDMILNKASCE